MKKIIITISLALACAIVAPMAEATESIIETVSQSYSTRVAICCFKGHMKISNKASVDVTDDGVMVTFCGDTYRARTSNRSDYDYMFTAGSGVTWYFNL